MDGTVVFANLPLGSAVEAVCHACYMHFDDCQAFHHGARWPWLQAGVSLSSRNIISMCVILFATTTLSGLGPITLAAHEILRQVWIFAIQVMQSACTSAVPKLSICSIVLH